MAKSNYSFTWNGARVNRLKKDLTKAMVTAAIAVSNDAKRGAPVFTGALVNSIRVDATKEGAVYVLAGGKVGGKKIAYAKYREYNNRKNPQTKFYMFKAFKNLEQNYPKYFKGLAK